MNNIFQILVICMLITFTQNLYSQTSKHGVITVHPEKRYLQYKEKETIGYWCWTMLQKSLPHPPAQNDIVSES